MTGKSQAPGASPALPFSLRNRNATLLVADGLSPADAVARTTELAIVAHPEDLATAGLPGIHNAFGSNEHMFSAIVCGDGLQTPPGPGFPRVPRSRLQQIRAQELANAAQIGHCAMLIHLQYPARMLRESRHHGLGDDLLEIISAMRPQIVYTHNPVETNETLLGIFISTVQALRRVHLGRRPRKLYACETHQSLDWVSEEDRVVFDVSLRPHLSDALLTAYDSILAGGSGLDQAYRNRRETQAILHPSKRHPHAKQLLSALDASTLIATSDTDPMDYITGLLTRFRDQTITRVARRLGQLDVEIRPDPRNRGVPVGDPRFST